MAATHLDLDSYRTTIALDMGRGARLCLGP